MFTGAVFQLSQMASVVEADLQVVRDCGFAYVGKIPTRLAPRLVACGQEAHVQQARDTGGIAGVIVPPALADQVPDNLGLAVAEAPLAALYQIQALLAAGPATGPDAGAGSDLPSQWQGFASRIHPSAQIMQGAYVAPRDVIIEQDVIIHPNAVIYPRSMIGKGSSIGAGSVVGTDAFEVDTAAQPRRILPQSGGVRIGAYVDIQAKCTIVRSSFGGFTEIGDETKFDCQVHFAHDCVAGARVRIAACGEISGRVTIGDDVFIGPNASVTNGCTIGAGAFVTLGAVVSRDVDTGARVTGHFAVEHKKWLSFLRTIR